MFENSSTYSALNSIKETLTNTLKNKYKIEDPQIVKEFLKTHGLHKSNFDVINNIETFIEETNMNDISIDDNANKSVKTVNSVIKENTSYFEKLIGFRYLYRQLKELYGREEAIRLTGDLYDYSLGISDSSKIYLNYCWAFNATPLVLEGKSFGQLASKPAKRLSSYISMLNESIHQLTHHLAGAIAITSIMYDAARLLLINEGYKLSDIRHNDTVRKYIENCFQNFVHSVNHLSRVTNESPFTNISIFDKVKLKTILSDKSMLEYFGNDHSVDYIVNYVYELQNIFLDFFDKGDPSKGGLPLRFPIITLNIAKNKKGEIEDHQFVRDVCKRDICKYNIFTSLGTRTAACCRLVSNKEMLELASYSNSFGGTGLSLGSHRVVTVNFNRLALESASKNDFFNLLKERTTSAAKVLKAHKELIIGLEKKGLQPFITNGWIAMSRMFSTFGILGIYECNKTLLSKSIVNNEEDFTKEVLEYFNKLVIELSEEYKINGNIEQIPAESFAHRLAKSDKLIYGEKKVPYNIYSNQFIPLWEDATLWERMAIDGKYNQLLTGGGICHIQLSDTITPIQSKKIIETAVSSGCEHFAINKIYTLCKNNHMSSYKTDTCPICESKEVDYITRVVGFFTPVSSWNKIKREEDFDKRKYVKYEKTEKKEG